MKDKIRIAAGQGFWGDLLDAPVRQVEGGPIDYLMLDYLAEVTMSIMQKQKARDPNAGYARDFVALMKEILPACVQRNIKVIANAGGVNVPGCAAAVAEVARQLGLNGKVKIGIVIGDDILGRIDSFLARGIELRNMDTGEPLNTVRDKIQSANAYLGAQPIVCDVFDRPGLFSAVRAFTPDVLLHELTDLPDELENLPEDSRLNARIRVEGTRNLLDALEGRG